jgi:hypothetical protein
MVLKKWGRTWGNKLRSTAKRRENHTTLFPLLAAPNLSEQKGRPNRNQPKGGENLSTLPSHPNHRSRQKPSKLDSPGRRGRRRF